MQQNHQLQTTINYEVFFFQRISYKNCIRPTLEMMLSPWAWNVNMDMWFTCFMLFASRIIGIHINFISFIFEFLVEIIQHIFQLISFFYSFPSFTYEKLKKSLSLWNILLGNRSEDNPPSLLKLP